MHSILAVVTVIKIDRLYPTSRSRALQPASSIYAASSFYNTEINSVHASSNTLNLPPQIINSLCIYLSTETGKKKNWSNLPVSFTTREFELNAVQVQSQKPPGLQYTHSICVVASCQQPSHSKSSRKTNVFVALSPGILKIGRQRGAKWQDPVFAFSDIPNPCTQQLLDRAPQASMCRPVAGCSSSSRQHRWTTSHAWQYFINCKPHGGYNQLVRNKN